ncbi:MAG: hypothetical protein QM765_41395 [Myxococcales bacterium]
MIFTKSGRVRATSSSTIARASWASPTSRMVVLTYQADSGQGTMARASGPGWPSTAVKMREARTSRGPASSPA